MNDLISRQGAIDAMSESLKRVFPEHRQIAEKCLNVLPSAQEKPFNLPEIYIAEGYDTIEGEDGNVGFGVYVPDETKIYVAGDVEGEIRARALFHEVCHWVQAMCGRPFDEDEANEFSDIVYDALPSAQETHEERAETHACDLIDREAAVDAIYHHLPSVSRTRARTMLHEVPSAQPEQRWILISERLPEEYEYVLLCDREPGPDEGTSYSRMAVGWLEDGQIHCWDDRAVREEFVAWMPLPEPYKEGEQE